jgi:hypothetical protein
MLEIAILFHSFILQARAIYFFSLGDKHFKTTKIRDEITIAWKPEMHLTLWRRIFLETLVVAQPIPLVLSGT